MTDDERAASFARFDKLMAALNVKWDGEMITENHRIYPEPVRSDFELQVKQEIQAWIKKQPPEKSWANPLLAAQEFWNERLK